jgi:hypothetical protein
MEVTLAELSQLAGQRIEGDDELLLDGRRLAYGQIREILLTKYPRVTGLKLRRHEPRIRFRCGEVTVWVLHKAGRSCAVFSQKPNPEMLRAEMPDCVCAGDLLCKGTALDGEWLLYETVLL